MMLSAASVPNATTGAIPVPAPFDGVASRSSAAAQPASLSSRTFADAVATARATNPALKATTTAKRRIPNQDASVRTSDTSQQTTVPSQKPVLPAQVAPAFVPTLALGDVSTSSQLVVVPALSFSFADESAAPSDSIAGVSLPSQPPALTWGGAIRPVSSDTSNDKIASSLEASVMPTSSTKSSAIEPDASLIQVDLQAKVESVPQDGPYNAKSGATALPAAPTRSATNFDFSELFSKNSPSAVQSGANVSMAPVANDSSNAHRPIEKNYDTDPSVSIDADELPTSHEDSPGAPMADSSTPAKQDQGAILQRIPTGLQNALNELPRMAAPVPPVTGDSGSGHLSDQRRSNSQPSNSVNENSGSAGDGSSQEAIAATPVTSAEAASKNSTSDLAVFINSGNPVVPVQQMPHSPAIATAPSAEAPATPVPQAKSTSSPSQPLPTPQTISTPLSDSMRATELYKQAANGDMHVAMQTDLLGTIDLHATMRQSTLTATIGVQRSDVQTLLANDLPALQHALADQHFHVEHIAVLDSSVGAHSGAAGGQQSEQNPWPSSPVARGFGKPGLVLANEFEIVSAASATASSRSGGQVTRLSIHV